MDPEFLSREIQSVFSNMEIPTTPRIFYLNRSQYLNLGGSDEGWDSIPEGVGNLKMLRS